MTDTIADRHLVSRHTADGWVFAERAVEGEHSWSGMEGHPLTTSEAEALHSSLPGVVVEPFPAR